MSISFTAEIIASAKNRGVALSPGDIESINENLGLITTVEDGAIRFTAGPFLDVHEAVEGMSRGYGKPVEQPAALSKPDGLNLPANATRTQQAIATNAAIRNGTADSKRGHATTLGNPWAAGKLNRTNQAYITNHNTELASQLKAQAGVA